jgi:hypothetical protein
LGRIPTSWIVRQTGEPDAGNPPVWFRLGKRGFYLRRFSAERAPASARSEATNQSLGAPPPPPEELDDDPVPPEELLLLDELLLLELELEEELILAMVMVSCTGALEPKALDAVSVTITVPAEVGVPEIIPVVASIFKPAGKPVAEKLVGISVVVIW